MVKIPCSQCRGLGSIPGQGTRSCMLQLSVHMLQLKTLCAAINQLQPKKKKRTMKGEVQAAVGACR